MEKVLTKDFLFIYGRVFASNTDIKNIDISTVWDFG